MYEDTKTNDRLSYKGEAVRAEDTFETLCVDEQELLEGVRFGVFIPGE